MWRKKRMKMKRRHRWLPARLQEQGLESIPGLFFIYRYKILIVHRQSAEEMPPESEVSDTESQINIQQSAMDEDSSEEEVEDLLDDE
jgi:hypothetical protein